MDKEKIIKELERIVNHSGQYLNDTNNFIDLKDEIYDLIKQAYRR